MGELERQPDAVRELGRRHVRHVRVELLRARRKAGGPVAAFAVTYRLPADGRLADVGFRIAYSVPPLKP